MENVFQHLVIGLAQYSQSRIESRSQYPYPPSLQHALNNLSLQFLLTEKKYPKSFGQVLTMFEKDVAEWWPDTLPLPDDMKYACLLYDGVITQEVDDYINSNKILYHSLGAYPAQLQGELDQESVARMVSVGRSDPLKYQNQYVFARRFLIEHPLASDQDFDNAYNTLSHDFYDLLYASYTQISNSDFSLYEHQGKLWKCPYCGSLLSWNHEEPYCKRHDLCARVTQKYTNPKPQIFKLSSDLYLIKKSIHGRTCVPGIPELRLEFELKSLVGELHVFLWPCIDIYDLLIHIPNSQKRIAIDLKDYRHPHDLVQKIRKDIAGPMSVKDDEQWGWDEFYFVVPDFRVEWNKNYLSEVHDLYKDRPVVSTSYMIEIIQKHID